jgi:predicted dehydrogenase
MNGRRDFLKCLTGGVVAGFPMIVPSSALGKDGYVAPSDKIVMAAIGVGRQGSGDMRGFLSQREVRMAAICDVNQATRERIAATVNRTYNDTSCATYNDYREVLGRSDIDALVIATGERWHQLIAAQAARAGKHMYCEKPLGLSIEACRAVREAINENSVAFQFGTQQRSSFYYRHAVELVRNGRIGELKTIMVGSVRGPNDTLYGEIKDPPLGFDYDMWLGPAPWAPYSDMRVSITAWLFISDYGLGCLDGAWGIHDIDIAQWVANADHTGPIDVEVEGTPTFYTDIRDVPHDYIVHHTYASGVRLIHMDMATARSRAPEFNSLPSTGATVIYGTEGWIFVSRDGIVTHPESLASEKIGPNQIQVIRSSDHKRNLLEAIRSGQKTICNIEVAVRDQTVIQQEYIALTLKRKLRWDPVAERFLDDPEANKMLSRPMRSPWHS